MTASLSRKEPLLCYITDRKAFAGGELERRKTLLGKIAEAASAGVDLVQLREKDLSGCELESLALAAAVTIQRSAPPGGGSSTKLLINGRPDIALAACAEGVHLPAQDLSPAEVRGVWAKVRSNASPILSVACHTIEEVRAAANARVEIVLFAPVFGKKNAPGIPGAGLEMLREACRIFVPVLALGGVTLANARACREAGAAGIAAIRLFQENDMAAVVRALRH